VKRFTMLASAITGSRFTACAQPLSASEFIQSDKPRETSPQVDETDLETLVNGNSEFAFDLYQALSQQDGNIFYSPYSISLALAMTYAGARGQTEEQMADTLHSSFPRTACIQL